jgi:hypothetical protein
MLFKSSLLIMVRMRFKKLSLTLLLLTIPFDRSCFGRWIESYYDCLCFKEGNETFCTRKVEATESDFLVYLSSFSGTNLDPKTALSQMRTAYMVLDQRGQSRPEEMACLQNLISVIKHAGIFAGRENALTRPGWLIRISALKDLSKEIYSAAQKCFDQQTSIDSAEFYLPNANLCLKIAN